MQSKPILSLLNMRNTCIMFQKPEDQLQIKKINRKKQESARMWRKRNTWAILA